MSITFACEMWMSFFLKPHYGIEKALTLTSIFHIVLADAVKQPCTAPPNVDIRIRYEGNHGAI